MCGNVSALGCLVFQNPCQGLARPERQRLAPIHPLWPTHQTPVLEAWPRFPGWDQKGLIGLLPSLFSHLLIPSLAQPLHFKKKKKKKLLRAVPKCVCPSCGTSTTVSRHVGTPPGERASCSRWSFAGPGADPQLGCWNRCSAVHL